MTYIEATQADPKFKAFARRRINGKSCAPKWAPAFKREGRKGILSVLGAYETGELVQAVWFVPGDEHRDGAIHATTSPVTARLVRQKDGVIDSEVIKVENEVWIHVTQNPVFWEPPKATATNVNRRAKETLRKMGIAA